MTRRWKGLLAVAAIVLIIDAFPVVLPQAAGPREAARAPPVITPLLTGVQDSLRAVDWDPVNDSALIAGDNGTVLSYNTTTAFRSHPQDVNYFFRDVAFRPGNSSTLALLVGSEQRFPPPGAGLALVYDGASFSRLATSDYREFRGAAWNPNGSAAYIIGQKGSNGVILSYRSGALTEVVNDSAHSYSAICWGEEGAFIAGYDFDNSRPAIQFFDGKSVTADVALPAGLDLDPTAISWSDPLHYGLCTGDLGNAGAILRFNITSAQKVQDPEPQGYLAGVAWAHSRPLALAAGADFDNLNDTNGLLYSYNGSALALESSNRYLPLTDAAWHSSDAYALVTGENGTVLRYTAPNSRPWCTITSPAALAAVGGTVNVTGTAGDLDNDPIVTVSVKIDSGGWQNATGGAGWSYRWDTVNFSNGAHTIYAKSNDGMDDSIQAETMVIVSNPNRPPTVSIASPPEGARVSGTVTVSGTSADPDAGDSVSGVQVAIDGSQWLNATGTENWSYSWDTKLYQDGPRKVRARAYDGEAYSGEETRNVTVQNGVPNLPPSCAITSPASGSVVSGLVSVQGSATDPEDYVQAVYIRIDAGAWQTATGNISWSFLWDTAPVQGGTHTVYARAFDGVQNSSDARLTLQVGHPPVCTITSPSAGAKVSGAVSIQGTATDQDPGDTITTVKVRIDSGDWVTATGTTSWTYKWNTSSSSSGDRVIRAKCSDGTLESGEVSRTVSLEKPPAAVTLSAPTEVGENHMVLQWSRNTDTDFARYEVFMSETESAPLSGLAPRVVPSQSVTTYNFTGLEPRHTYWFRVRVVDNTGLTSVSNEVYGTTLRENQQPVASLTASRTRAHVGESITFGADASYDPDRGDRLVRFQWDFEGRGRFPLDTGPISSQRHEFTKAGKYMVQVRVSDNRGASSVGTINVTILEKENTGPDAATSTLVAVIIIAALVVLGVLVAIRRRPPAETYYEERVHKPVARRRQDYWPDDEEITPVRKVVKKRRV